MDERFAHVDEKFRQVDTRFDRVDSELSRVNDRLDALQRSIIQVGGGLIVALIGMMATFLAVTVTQL